MPLEIVFTLVEMLFDAPGAQSTTVYRQIASQRPATGGSINMVRFLGANLPDSKKLWVALTKVYGIGYSRARALCFAIGATPHVSAGELRPHHLSHLYTLVENRFVVGRELRSATRAAVQRLIRIRCYRGKRHVERLPVRGQRTHTNARTQKKLPNPGGHSSAGGGGSGPAAPAANTRK